MTLRNVLAQQYKDAETRKSASSEVSKTLGICSHTARSTTKGRPAAAEDVWGENASFHETRLLVRNGVGAVETTSHQ